MRTENLADERDGSRDDSDESCVASMRRDVMEIFSTGILLRLDSDGRNLFLTRTIRLFTFGFLAVILMRYFTCIGLTMADAGYVCTGSLIIDGMVSLTLTSNADETYGRRNVLLYSSIVCCITGFLFATLYDHPIVVPIAIIGFISPSGNEIGPFQALEISCLSRLIGESERVRLLSWYNLFGSIATAFGALTCGVLVDLQLEYFSNSPENVYRAQLLIYMLLQCMCVYSYSCLSDNVEVPVEIKLLSTHRTNSLTITSFFGLHQSKMVVVSLSGLFFIDAFAGAFTMQSFISEWFFLVYNTSASTIGMILFFCNLLAGLSALFASKLAEVSINSH